MDEATYLEPGPPSWEKEFDMQFMHYVRTVSLVSESPAEAAFPQL